MSSPIGGLAAVAYLSYQAAKLESQGIEDIDEVEIVPFDGLDEADQEAWASAVAGVLGANKMLLVVTPVPQIAKVMKHVHDRAVSMNLVLPGASVVGPEWDAAVLAAFDAAHIVIPAEIESVERCGNHFLTTKGRHLYLPEKIKNGDRAVVAFMPLEEEPDEAPC